jgi:hypothetical protein
VLAADGVFRSVLTFRLPTSILAFGSMFSLTLIYFLALISGLSLSSILALPTRLLVWTIAVTAGFGQLILSVQILSLICQLNGGSLLMANAAATIAFGSLASYWRRRRKLERAVGAPQLRLNQVFDEFGRINVLFGGMVFLAFAFTSLAASILFPANDAYHFNMCLFWKQNQSIQAFAVHDPRITSVAFASEALALPGVVFADSSVGFIGLSLVAAILISCIIYALSRGIGSSRRVAFAASLVFSASTPLLASILGAKSDFLLSTLWLLGSVHCLFEMRSFPDRAQCLLACSAFCLPWLAGRKTPLHCRLRHTRWQLFCSLDARHFAADSFILRCFSRSLDWLYLDFCGAISKTNFGSATGADILSSRRRSRKTMTSRVFGPV